MTADEVRAHALELIAQMDTTEDARTMLRAVVAAPNDTAKALALHLGVPVTSINIRLMRAGLPTLRQLMAWYRVMLIKAWLDEGLARETVAYRAGFAGGVALNRHLKDLLGLTVTETRAAPRVTITTTWATMLDREGWLDVWPLRGHDESHADTGEAA